MPHNFTWDEDDEVDESSTLRREGEEDEVGLEDEWRDECEAVTTVCPYCLAMIDEQSERCPECGMYICEEDAPRHTSRWVWIGFLLSAMAVAGFAVQHYF